MYKFIQLQPCFTNFHFPTIDQLMDASMGHELLSFMDAYSSYNQISMHLVDEENTSFITHRCSIATR